MKYLFSTAQQLNSSTAQQLNSSTAQQLITLLLAFLVFSTSSCRNDLEQIDPKSQQKTSKNGRIETLTGTKLESPYTVENMRQALDNVWNGSYLKQSQFATLVKPQFKIAATHYYIKFSPTSEEEEALLKSDTSLILFDYPLDYEFTDEDLANRQGTLEDIPEYYTTISVRQELPRGINFEILETLFYPEDSPYFADLIEEEENQVNQRGVINTKEELFKNLLFEAHSQTGSLDDMFVLLDPEDPVTPTIPSFWFWSTMAT